MSLVPPKLSPTQQDRMTAAVMKSAQRSMLFDPSMMDHLSTTVDKRKCTGCGVKGRPNARLMMCKGCTSERIRYCSDVCQEADWPTHRVACRKQAAFLKSLSPQASKLYSDIQTWVHDFACIFDLAGFEALLPSPGYLDHHLLDTHFISIFVRETPEGSGSFEIDFARVPPLEMLEGFYDGVTKDKEDLATDLKPFRTAAVRPVKRRRRAACKETEVVGTMKMMVHLVKHSTISLPPIVQAVEVTEDSLRLQRQCAFFGFEHWENCLKARCRGGLQEGSRVVAIECFIGMKTVRGKLVPQFTPVGRNRMGGR